jgi:hypothetical protein
MLRKWARREGACWLDIFINYTFKELEYAGNTQAIIAVTSNLPDVSPIEPES